MINVSLDNRAVVAALRGLEGWTEKGCARALNQIGAYMLREAGERVRPRSMAIANSIQAQKATVETLVFRLGSAHPAARITHFGGVIRPNPNPGPDLIRRRVFGAKPIKYLTLPLTQLGHVKEGDRARDFSNLFVLIRHGKPYLAQRLVQGSNRKTRKLQEGFGGRLGRRIDKGTEEERSQGVRLLFALVASVTVPKWPYLYFSAENVAFAERTIKRELEGVQAGGTTEG